jgi:hypothetical protein
MALCWCLSRLPTSCACLADLVLIVARLLNSTCEACHTHAELFKHFGAVAYGARSILLRGALIYLFDIDKVRSQLSLESGHWGMALTTPQVRQSPIEALLDCGTLAGNLARHGSPGLAVDLPNESQISPRYRRLGAGDFRRNGCRIRWARPRGSHA